MTNVLYCTIWTPPPLFFFYGLLTKPNITFRYTITYFITTRFTHNSSPSYQIFIINNVIAHHNQTSSLYLELSFLLLHNLRMFWTRWKNDLKCILKKCNYAFANASLFIVKALITYFENTSLFIYLFIGYMDF